MTDLTFQGQPVHGRLVRNLGALHLSRDPRHRLVLQIPLGAPDNAASLFLQGLSASFTPMTSTEASLLLFLQSTAPEFCDRLQVPVPRVELFHSGKLWGSCDWEHGIVRLHAALAFFPQSVREEALLHELCHLRIHDHSPAFWQLLTAQMPDWPYWEGVLRQHKGKAGTASVPAP